MNLALLLVQIINKNLWKIEGFHFDLLNTKVIEKLKNFQRSMRWMVHFPLFMMLEQTKKMRLVHLVLSVKMVVHLYLPD